jgi:two-component system, OmpR family, phosphate regulon sensor histidine kinase PhoR
VDDPTTVLVVDDEEGMREGMRRVLERRGFSVDTAADGGSALARLAERDFDLALVDLKMPGIDGFRVTQAVNESGRETVVVIVSALATVEAAVEVTRHGAFDFLVKPFAPADLLQVVDRAVKQRRLIGDRRMYLSELNRERTLSRQLINSLHDGVIVLNVNAKPLLMNTRAEFLLDTRYREDMALEELGLDLSVIAVVREMLSPEAGGPDLQQLRLPHGEAMLRLVFAPWRRVGEPGGLILVITDVTDEWKTERDKNRFIGMVAHELTSPLAAIVGYIDVVLSGVLDGTPEKLHEVMRGSKTRAEALLDLVKDLQYLNRREAGKIERTIARLDLKKVLEEQLRFFAAQAERAKVALVLEADLPSCEYCADRGDLDRIFMNLISNGIKYNQEGGRLTVSLEKRGGALEAVFADTGIGMSPEETQGIFQEFYRARNARTEGIAGTGLGLATVKRVLDQYNGRITVCSVPGEGTTFRVTFPLGVEERDDEARAAAEDKPQDR